MPWLRLSRALLGVSPPRALPQRRVWHSRAARHVPGARPQPQDQARTLRPPLGGGQGARCDLLGPRLPHLETAVWSVTGRGDRVGGACPPTRSSPGLPPPPDSASSLPACKVIPGQVSSDLDPPEPRPSQSPHPLAWSHRAAPRLPSQHSACPGAQAGLGNGFGEPRPPLRPNCPAPPARAPAPALAPAPAPPTLQDAGPRSVLRPAGLRPAQGSPGFPGVPFPDPRSKAQPEPEAPSASPWAARRCAPRAPAPPSHGTPSPHPRGTCHPHFQEPGAV